MLKRVASFVLGFAVMFVAFGPAVLAQATGDTAAKPAEAPKAPELPSWLKDFKFAADLRLRYEGVWYDQTTEDQQHGRFRLRFGGEKKMTDEWLFGFRVASGKDSDPTSTNQTLTNNNDKKSLWIDLAYATYKPSQVPGLTLGGGKVKNPWVSTDLLWDSDVNPEGAYATYRTKLTDSFEPFVTGAYILTFENSGAKRDDANMVSAQAGFDWKVADPLSWTMAAAVYNYLNYAESGNWNKSNGNTSSAGVLTAQDFNIIDVTNMVRFKVGELPFTVFGDYARNTGEDAPAPDDGEDTAYAVGLKIGDTKDKGQWSADYKYARIEANSVVGAFNDADFGNANRKGHKVGFNYAIQKNVVAGLALFVTEPVSGASDEERTILHADLVVNF